MDQILRLEVTADYRIVEELTRDAFWDHHVPVVTNTIWRIFSDHHPILSLSWTSWLLLSKLMVDGRLPATLCTPKQ